MLWQSGNWLNSLDLHSVFCPSNPEPQCLGCPDLSYLQGQGGARHVHRPLEDPKVPGRPRLRCFGGHEAVLPHEQQEEPQVPSQGSQDGAVLQGIKPPLTGIWAAQGGALVRRRLALSPSGRPAPGRLTLLEPRRPRGAAPTAASLVPPVPTAFRPGEEDCRKSCWAVRKGGGGRSRGRASSVLRPPVLPPSSAH